MPESYLQANDDALERDLADVMGLYPAETDGNLEAARGATRSGINYLNEAARSMMGPHLYQGATNLLEMSPAPAARDYLEAGAELGQSALEGDPAGAVGGLGGAGLAILGGIPGVKTGPLKNMLLKRQQMAEGLEKAGESPDRIWKWTGLERGADGQWRHEISDVDAKFQLEGVGSGSRLEGVMEHPELYEHYPRLKDVQVHYDPNLSARGQYDEWPAITLGPGGSTPQTLLHETQHGVQDIGRLARGGNPNEIGREYSKIRDNAIGNKWSLKTDIDAGKSEAVIFDPATSRPIKVSGKKKLKQLLQAMEELSEAPSPDAYDKYRKLAGEVEARNVSERYTMGRTDAALREPTEPPYLQVARPAMTEDVPRSQQEVRYRDTQLETDLMELIGP